MSWLPDDFFIGHLDRPEQLPHRPIGQGDVFERVPVAGRTIVKNGELGLKAKRETVIIVASSCGMRKSAGELNDEVHAAPIKRLSSLAPGWEDPWEGWLHVLPLPGLSLGGGEDLVGANLARIGLCGSDTLQRANRLACVSLAGMGALKARLSTYFTRTPIPEELVGVGAYEEWHELSLWEQWATRTETEAGFQEWLDAKNPNYPERRRRDTIFDDLEGVREQLTLVRGCD